MAIFQADSFKLTQVYSALEDQELLLQNGTHAEEKTFGRAHLVTILPNGLDWNCSHFYFLHFLSHQFC